VIGGALLGSIPGHDQLILCLHNTFVIDPKTGDEAESYFLHTTHSFFFRECLRTTVRFASMILLNKVQRDLFDSGSNLTEKQICWTQRE
jgi:hypothetical protein